MGSTIVALGVIFVSVTALAIFAFLYQPSSPDPTLLNDETILDEDGWEYIALSGQPEARYVNGPNKGKRRNYVLEQREALKALAA